MSHAPTAIRPALPEDAEGIARVHVDVWKTTYRGIVPDPYLANLSHQQRAERWRSQLEQAGADVWIFVADDPASGVVGFVSGGRERTGDPVYKGELYAIYVLEAFQHQGLGEQLTVALVKHLIKAGYTSMLLWVLKNNLGARRFYERLGGVELRTQAVEIGGVSLEEVAYGWEDIRTIIAARPGIGKVARRRSRSPLVVIDYDPTWPEQYEVERSRVEAALGDVVLAIHHIGSTAVPGLAAKPTIDMLVELRTLDIPEDRIAAMELLGYEYRGEYGLPGRRYFSDGRRRHVHAWLAGHPAIERHLVFRDYLRAHPEEAARYAALKRRLAEGREDDPDGYQEAKQPFIEAAIERAVIWKAARR